MTAFDRDRCAAHRRALDLARDGEPVDAGALDAARAHADDCDRCAADAAAAVAVADHLRRRAGTPPARAAADLRTRVLARIRRGDAEVVHLRDFLRRAAALAAAVLLVSVSLAVRRELERAPRAPMRGPGIARHEIVAGIVAPAVRPGR